MANPYGASGARVSPAQTNIDDLINLAGLTNWWNTNAAKAKAAAATTKASVAPAAKLVGGVARNPFISAPIATALTVAPDVIGDLQGGRPLDAAVSAGGALTGGLIGGGLGTLTGPLAPVAVPLLASLGASWGTKAGDLAEGIKAGITGDPIGRDPHQAALKKQKQQLELLGLTDQHDLARSKALYDLQREQQIEMQKESANQLVDLQTRLTPIMEQRQRSALVRQQALNAHTTHLNAMMGTLATAGRLAQGAQAEAGATLRTALTANPYAGSIMQAPRVSFG